MPRIKIEILWVEERHIHYKRTIKRRTSGRGNSGFVKQSEHRKANRAKRGHYETRILMEPEARRDCGLLGERVTEPFFSSYIYLGKGKLLEMSGYDMDTVPDEA